MKWVSNVCFVPIDGLSQPSIQRSISLEPKYLSCSATDAVAYAKVHLKTWADYDWKERALRDMFGLQPAAEITPRRSMAF